MIVIDVKGEQNWHVRHV